MSDLLDRILCNNNVHQQIQIATKCLQCGSQNTNNHLYNTNCHNGTYCNDCIHKCSSKHIPFPNEKLITLLRNVRIRCINTQNGCNELLVFDQVQEHEHSCIFKTPFAPSDKKFPSLSNNQTKPRTESRFFTQFTNTQPPCSPSISIEIASITSRNFFSRHFHDRD